MGPTEDAFLHSLLTVTSVDALRFECCRGLDSAWALNCLGLGLNVLTLYRAAKAGTPNAETLILRTIKKTLLVFGYPKLKTPVPQPYISLSTLM